MMTQAFYTGITGIQTNATGIDIISDNLANIDTVGFKGTGYEFSNMYQSMLNTPNESPTGSSVNSGIGTGVRLQATPLIKQTGTLIPTDRSTDLAILGDGWFGMLGEGDPIYTRDGAFTFDSNTDLVSVDGLYVLGSMGGNISDNNVLTQTLDDVPLGDINSQEKLHFPKTLTYPPEASSLAKFYGNIGTDDETRTMGASVVDPENNKNHLQIQFTKVATQTPPGSQWDVVATTKSIDDTIIYDTQTGVVNFDSSGALVSTTLSNIDNNGALVNIDLGTGFNGVTAVSNTPISSSNTANGTIGGDLMGYDINKNGVVIATFTNGIQSSVGRIAVYHFQNDQGLDRLNGSRFQSTSNSGDAIFFQDANGNNVIGSDITNFNLEGSNISMSYGLTELIILQRAYDANSKSITTADEMMQKALNMDA